MNRTAVTLVELLVVLAIVALAAGMIIRVPSTTDRGAQVQAAAEQLAATLQMVRNRAIDDKTTYGVAFHIQNAPGTSGRVLNNWSGGHYYRIIGPRLNQSMASGTEARYIDQNSEIFDYVIGGVPAASRSSNHLLSGTLSPSTTLENPFPLFLEEVADSWIGDPIRLPTRKVRFLALADQDNGNVRYWKDATNCHVYGPTYPRPWFGRLTTDGAQVRLHPWGGYDPTIKDFDQGNAVSRPGGVTDPFLSPFTGQPVSYSGFYYEGNDGEIPGSVHPRDRLIANDDNRDGQHTSSDSVSYPLFTTGKPRPLVNADWLDATIVFRPDGTAAYASWMNGRHQWAYGSFTSMYRASIGNLHQVGPADMCNQLKQTSNKWGGEEAYLMEASHYTPVTGRWYITLGPDMEQDSDRFANPTQAWRSLMPARRVSVSPTGEVRVVPVRASIPSGTNLDDTVRDTWYETRNNLRSRFRAGMLRSASGARQRPIEDFLTPEILSRGAWWMTP
jgi:Tfp pilus assembly protein FimT